MQSIEAVWRRLIRYARQSILFGLILLACLSSSSLADAQNIQVGNEPHYVLSRHFSVLRHAGPALSLQQVLDLQQQGEFRGIEPGSTASTNFGLTRDQVWLFQSFTTTGNVPQRWFLEVAHASLDSIDVYVAEQGGSYTQDRKSVV